MVGRLSGDMEEPLGVFCRGTDEKGDGYDCTGERWVEMGAGREYGWEGTVGLRREDRLDGELAFMGICDW